MKTRQTAMIQRAQAAIHYAPDCVRDLQCAVAQATALLDIQAATLSRLRGGGDNEALEKTIENGVVWLAETVSENLRTACEVVHAQVEILRSIPTEGQRRGAI